MRGDFTVDVRATSPAPGRRRDRQPAGVVLGPAAGAGHRRDAVRGADQRTVRARRDGRVGARRARRRPGHRVSLDGEPSSTLAEPQRGGAFFGMGSPEVRGTVELEEGRRVRADRRLPGRPDRSWCAASSSAPDRCRPATTSSGRPPRPRAADVAVVIVGTDDDWETEGEDRTVAGAARRPGRAGRAPSSPPTRTRSSSLNAGSPVTMPWLDDVPAVLQLWFPGQEIGDALADVLTGDAEPGGRLPMTFPARLEDTPAFAHHPGTDGRAVYAEGLFIGHRWYDREGIEPLFPFGHGLGYTTFELGTAGVGGSVERRRRRRRSTVTQHRRRAPAARSSRSTSSRRPATPARPLRHLAGFGRRSTSRPASEGTVTIDARPAGVRLVARRRLDRAARRVRRSTPAAPPPTCRERGRSRSDHPSRRCGARHLIAYAGGRADTSGGYSRQSIGSRPAAARAALARENGSEPKKPLCADSGDGWADSMIVWRAVSMSACFLRAWLPHRMNTTGCPWRRRCG